MIKIVCLKSFVILFFSMAFSAYTKAADIKDKFQVDLNKYIGLWYETARTKNKFQDNTLNHKGLSYGACFNSTARYQLDSSGRIKVFNTCFRKAKTGKVYKDTIRGLASGQNDPEKRRLKIAFGSGVAQFFQRAISGGGFPYWIYCLGPINKKGLYDWAVVSGPDKDYLYFLTRDKQISNKKKQVMISCAKKNNLPVSALLYKQR